APAKMLGWFNIFLRRYLMEALRVITKPVNGQLVITLPVTLSSDQPYEVIVLPAAAFEPITTPGRRQPSPRLAGSARLQDDLVAPAGPDSDWESS
ncbi:MAG: hypothetical protein ACRERY_09450, partial [Pseudomonas sp.]